MKNVICFGVAALTLSLSSVVKANETSLLNYREKGSIISLDSQLEYGVIGHQEVVLNHVRSVYGPLVQLHFDRSLRCLATSGVNPSAVFGTCLIQGDFSELNTSAIFAVTLSPLGGDLEAQEFDLTVKLLFVEQ